LYLKRDRPIEACHEVGDDDDDDDKKYSTKMKEQIFSDLYGVIGPWLFVLRLT
jgi:hypothetical protein